MKRKKVKDKHQIDGDGINSVVSCCPQTNFKEIMSPEDTRSKSMDLNRIPKDNADIPINEESNSQNQLNLEKETNDTMEIGRYIGIDLSGFEKNIRSIITGEGVNTGK